MKRIAKSIVAMLMLVGFAGCTSMHMLNNPTAEMSMLQRADIPKNVGLYVTPAFSGYIYEDTDGGEMSNLRYKLGAASVLLFEDTLARAAKSVKVVSSKPPYDGQLQHIEVVIQPSIASFSQKNPMLTRIGKYSAEITYDVKVYDQEGKLISDKTYSGSGARNGIATQSPGHNYEIAAGLAMQDAVSKAVKDIATAVRK